jgi:hypothetical protein
MVEHGKAKEKPEWSFMADWLSMAAGPAELDLRRDLPVVPARSVAWPMRFGLVFPFATPSPVEGRLADHPAGENVYPWQMLP